MDKILIADDDPVMVKLLEYNIKRFGYECISCREGETVIARALETRPALVILDHLLPGRSGLELIGDFKANPDLHMIPLIVVTGHGKESLREELLAAGARRVFTKPFSPTNLSACIEELVSE